MQVMGFIRANGFLLYFLPSSCRYNARDIPLRRSHLAENSERVCRRISINN